MSKSPIAILGAGNIASALALVLSRHKFPVRLYCIEPSVEQDIRKNACNSKYLIGHCFPKSVTASSDLETVLTGALDVIVAVPSFAACEVITKAKPFLDKDIQSITSIAKGFDEVSLEPIAFSVLRLLPAKLQKKFCVLGGPTIAHELANGSPTGFVVAGSDSKAVHRVQSLLTGNSITCATSRDTLGVSLAASIKNAYAIALGMCDGLKLPTNAKALVLTIAMKELELLLQKAGAKHDTAMGLAGLGDLVVTGMSHESHNRKYGERIVGAKSLKPSDLKLGIVEGIAATKLGVKLTTMLKVKLPLLNTIDQCLRNRKNFERPFVDFLNHLNLS
ncbi:MAG: NAD(P)H-dependent glycerol-3-phosphate dehydrogenase [Candidatus Uhrbacteria bacterium]